MLSQFLLWLKTFVVQEEEGQTLLEYALIIVLIVIVVIAFMGPLGDAIGAAYDRITGELGAVE